MFKGARGKGDPTQQLLLPVASRRPAQSPYQRSDKNEHHHDNRHPGEHPPTGFARGRPLDVYFEIRGPFTILGIGGWQSVAALRVGLSLTEAAFPACVTLVT
jgi:hypothetical protein